MKKEILGRINRRLYSHNLFDIDLPIKTIDQVLQISNLDVDFELNVLAQDYIRINKGLGPYYSQLGRKFRRIQKRESKKINTFINNILDDTTCEVIEILEYLSPNSCIVGGSVRDIILYKKPKDFDFVTDVEYNILKNEFIKQGFNVKEVGKQFLVLLVSKNGIDYEIANFRKDRTYKDGRRPESVQIGTIFDDAQRRDLTINALYFNLLNRKIQDPNLQGLFDIDQKILRFIGKPEDRIEEDKLRVFRFYRFIQKTEFIPEKNSLKAVRSNFERAIKETSSERIKSEVERMIGL